jgi:hypothetical protein
MNMPRNRDAHQVRERRGEHRLHRQLRMADSAADAAHDPEVAIMPNETDAGRKTLNMGRDSIAEDCITVDAPRIYEVAAAGASTYFARRRTLLLLTQSHSISNANAIP